MTESFRVVEVANELATNLDVVEGGVLQRGGLVAGQGDRAKPGVKVRIASVNDPAVVKAMVCALRRRGLGRRKAGRYTYLQMRDLE